MKNSETLETIRSIIRYGLDGNAPAVSGNAEILARKYEENGDRDAAELIRDEIKKPRPMPLCMQNWWNSFSSVAEEMLAKDPSAEETCHNALKNAGITQRDAEEWLYSEEAQERTRTRQAVTNYIDTL